MKSFRYILIVGLLLMQSIIIFDSVNADTSPYSDNWWDTNYEYRTKLQVYLPGTSSLASVSGGYQMQVQVNYGSGSNTKTNLAGYSFMNYAVIYVNGNCRSDFGDIRFVNESGTEYYSWRESYTESSTAMFWVNIADTVTSSNTTFYCYFGNSSATRPSEESSDELTQMDNTFEFAENFYNNYRWFEWTPTGTPSESDDSVFLDSGSPDEELDSTDTYGVNHSLHVTAKAKNSIVDDAYICAFTGYSKIFRIEGDDSDTNDLEMTVYGSNYDNLGYDGELDNYFYNYDLYVFDYRGYGMFDKYDLYSNRLIKASAGGDLITGTARIELRGGDGGDGIYIDECYVTKCYYDGPLFRTPGSTEFYTVMEETVTATNVEETSATISSTLYYGESVECGFWVGNTSVNASNYLWNYSVGDYSGFGTAFSKSLTGLESGEYYYYRAWVNGSDFFVNATFDGTFLTKPNPPTNVSFVSNNDTNITIEWDNAEVCDGTNRSTVVVYSDSSVPTSIDEGTICYNGSDSSVTVEGLAFDTTYYFSAFTYINASGSPFYWWYSDLFDFVASSTSGGTYNVDVRWECNESLINLSGKSNVFKAYSENGTVVHNSTPTDADGNFSFSSGSTRPAYISLIYDNSIVRTVLFPPVENNVTIYIPCGEIGTDIGDVTPVTIFFKDYTGYLTTENDAIAYIFKYNGTTPVYYHSQYIEADLAIRAYLTIGDVYFIGAGCNQFSKDLGTLTIFEDEYEIDVFYEPVNYHEFYQIFNISYGWSGTDVFIDFEDTSKSGVEGVQSVTVSLYNFSNGSAIDTEDMVVPWNFNYTYGPLDASNGFKASLEVTYLTDEESWSRTIWVYWLPLSDTIIDDPSEIDEAITNIVGNSPVRIEEVVVAWTSLGAAFASIFIFFTFSPRLSGFGIIIVGFVLAFFKNPLGLISDDTLSWVVVGTIIIIGLISFIVIKKGDR